MCSAIYSIYRQYLLRISTCSHWFLQYVYMYIQPVCIRKHFIMYFVKWCICKYLSICRRPYEAHLIQIDYTHSYTPKAQSDYKLAHRDPSFIHNHVMSLCLVSQTNQLHITPTRHPRPQCGRVDFIARIFIVSVFQRGSHQLWMLVQLFHFIMLMERMQMFNFT